MKEPNKVDWLQAIDGVDGEKESAPRPLFRPNTSGREVEKELCSLE